MGNVICLEVVLVCFKLEHKTWLDSQFPGKLAGVYGIYETSGGARYFEGVLFFEVGTHRGV